MLHLIETSKKLVEIETIRVVDSQTCDEINVKQANIDQQLEDECTRVNKILSDIERLEKENARLSEEVLDLKTRTMKDNLLFLGMGKCTTTVDRRSEDCAAKLNITNSKYGIKIDRAHRIGRISQEKKRPIVVTFNYFQDKVTVKQKAYSVLDKDAPYRVSDQYPKTDPRSSSYTDPCNHWSQTTG